jgi:hypothetical protein
MYIARIAGICLQKMGCRWHPAARGEKWFREKVAEEISMAVSPVAFLTATI